VELEQCHDKQNRQKHAASRNRMLCRGETKEDVHRFRSLHCHAKMNTGPGIKMYLEHRPISLSAARTNGMNIYSYIYTPKYMPRL